jgi:hypothetical protein
VRSSERPRVGPDPRAPADWDLSTGDARSDAHAFYERLGFSDNARALTRRLDEALSASPPAHGTPR